MATRWQRDPKNLPHRRRYNEKYRANHKLHCRYLSARSSTRSFFRHHATLNDLKNFRAMELERIRTHQYQPYNPKINDK